MDGFGHEEHPWIGQQVRDIACKGEGVLTAVVREKVTGGRFVRLAYIKPASGIEWSTHSDNVQLVR